MKRVAAKFVPRALTDNQKECRVETCRALKQQLETDPDFLSKNYGNYYKYSAPKVALFLAAVDKT
ncbi:hypothetical protein NQ318_021261 [Aromia moschata]|uniref:Uncharacterized protein n=1 Tax=Aromia moschata TaxID=1265417 RepID=A0AAV8ZBS2_9CUCU|nr:hypothetical protein NQ318_021261 [Aromia moschata]